MNLIRASVLIWLLLIVQWISLAAVDQNFIVDYWPITHSTSVVFENYYRVGLFRADFKSSSLIFDFFILADDRFSVAYKSKEFLQVKTKGNDDAPGTVKALTPFISPESTEFIVEYEILNLPPDFTLRWSFETDAISGLAEQEASITLNPNENRVELSANSSGLGRQVFHHGLSQDRIDGVLELAYSQEARLFSARVNHQCLGEVPVEFFEPFRLVFRGNLQSKEDTLDIIFRKIDSERSWTHSRSESKEIIHFAEQLGAETVFWKVTTDGSRQDWFIKDHGETTSIALMHSVLDSSQGQKLTSKYDPPVIILKWPVISGETWSIDSNVTNSSSPSVPVHYHGEVLSTTAMVKSFREWYLDCLVVDGIYSFPDRQIYNRYYFAPDVGLVRQEQFPNAQDYRVVELKHSSQIKALATPMIYGRIETATDNYLLTITVDAVGHDLWPQLLVLWLQINGVPFYWNGMLFTEQFAAHSVEINHYNRSSIMQINVALNGLLTDDINVSLHAVFTDPQNPRRLSSLSSYRLRNPCL